MEGLADLLLRTTGKYEGKRNGMFVDRVCQYFENISLRFGITTFVQPIYYYDFWSGIHEVDPATGSSRFKGLDNKGVHLGLKGSREEGRIVE